MPLSLHPRGCHSGGHCSACNRTFQWRDLVRHPRIPTSKVCSPCAAAIRRDMATASLTPTLPTQQAPAPAGRLTRTAPVVFDATTEAFINGETKP